MLKKISSLKLLGILMALVLIYLASNYFSRGSRSESLRSELVTIDTSQISKILISSPNENLELHRIDSSWVLKLENGKEVPALRDKVTNTLSSLLSIQPERMVTRDQAKWKDYQVDSTGTRIQVFENDLNTLDLVVGRFGMAGQRQFYSFVRLSEDTEVYTADNFMGLSGGNQSSSYRNQDIIKTEPDSIIAIQFSYPADSSFQLSRYDSSWLVNQTIQTDSAAVASYLLDLRSVTSKQFADHVDPSTLNNELFKLRIDSKSELPLTVKAFKGLGADQLFYQSSLNTSYFQDTTLLDQLFKGVGHFKTGGNTLSGQTP